uniref:Uncharacterized protein n=1 Tax=Oryza punctata TaxID=4537 RepID=A0A0E0MK35_ORYPU
MSLSPGRLRRHQAPDAATPSLLSPASPSPEWVPAKPAAWRRRGFFSLSVAGWLGTKPRLRRGVGAAPPKSGPLCLDLDGEKPASAGGGASGTVGGCGGGDGPDGNSGSRGKVVGQRAWWHVRIEAAVAVGRSRQVPADLRGRSDLLGGGGVEGEEACEGAREVGAGRCWC